MRPLTKLRRNAVLLLAIVALTAVGWLYWNRVPAADLAVWAPADSLAYVEVNDLGALVLGMEQTTAWKSIGPLLGVPANLAGNQTLIRLARWTGIGSADALLFARSQVAVVFSGAEGTQSGSALVIKPVLTMIIETHTSARRVRPALESHLEQMALSDFGNPTFVRKQVGGYELSEWQSEDGARKIVFAFVNTTVIIANDESAVVRSIEAAAGSRPSLKSQTEVDQVRRQTNSGSAIVFGFVTQPGIKSLLQTYWLRAESAEGVSGDTITKARWFSDIFGGILQHMGWTARFVGGEVEDRFSITLADGVAERLQASMSPDRPPDLAQLPFVPADTHSLSIYSFHDTATVWNDLGAVIASHADLLGAMAARPVMQKLLTSYGIADAETFTRGIGTRLQTVRTQEGSPAVLIAEVFDRPTIEKAIASHFGSTAKKEKLGEADLQIAADNWAAAFVQNSFLIGPADEVRKCLQARVDGQSLSSTQPFREAQRFVDVSLPLISLTFSDDSRSAVAFVDALSHQPRSAFSVNAAAIAASSQKLPLAMTAVVMRQGSLEWTSRSSFGVAGAIATELLQAK
ncbi:MAG TPA: hypothetical protein VE961_04020 [Pyrinomonadaceae bacterium]|nr:hypothetical protein [Pyrinomonadaceae bacterium]